MRFYGIVWVGSLVSLLLGTAGRADDDWSSFRNGGSSHAGGEFDYATEWSPSKNIVWQSELPGYGQSSPMIWENRIYVSCVKGPMKEQNRVEAYRLDSGEHLWSMPRPSSHGGPSNYMYSRAAPSPVVDGEGVVAFFESGDLVAIDHDGKLRWELDLSSDLGEIDSRHGLATSPVQDDAHVFLDVQHSGSSFLFAVEKATGAISWKAARPSQNSWNSPIVISINGKQQLVVCSGGILSSYDPATGKELWQVADLPSTTKVSPMCVGDRIVVGAEQPGRRSSSSSSEPARRESVSVRVAENGNSAGVAWRSASGVCDYASPISDGQRVYFFNQQGIVRSLDLETGQLLIAKRLGFDIWATPILAGRAIYCFGKNGETAVLEASDSLALISTNRLWSEADIPQPTQYREHIESSRSSSGSESVAENFSELLEMHDSNEDGRLSGNEVAASLSRADANSDGEVDETEWVAYQTSLTARRQSARESNRDPIVYAAAASHGYFVVRTGTRLYVIAK